jgi:hypothetical protein
MNAAETSGDPDLLMVGLHMAGSAYIWLGDPIKTREQASRVLALCNKDGHARLVGILPTPKTASLAHLAQSTWCLGYPDLAAQLWQDCEAHARELGYPFDLGWALTTGAMVFDFFGEPDESLKRIEEADRLGRENSLPILTECIVPAWAGVALIRKGEVTEGMALLNRGMAFWEGVGAQQAIPRMKSALAEGMARLGDCTGALDLVDEAIAQVERPGWEERWYYPETLRIKGWLLARKGDPEGAERAYIASLDWARTQQAKSWELRTATSYARLMRDRGRVGEAHGLLGPIYGWFTEGFDTPDLKEAKALLGELG